MKRTNPVYELLRRIPGMANVSDKDLARLAPLVDIATLAAGSKLVRQGTLAHQTFVVIEGHAEVLVDDELIATVGPGAFVGEMAMLDLDRRCATVRALTPMLVLVIGPQAFAAFANHPAVTRAMAVQLCQRLRQSQGVIDGFRAIPSRI